VAAFPQRLEDLVPKMDASVVERHSDFHVQDRT
jgi:hypothetical protein